MFNMVITGSFITFCLIMLVKQWKVTSNYSLNSLFVLEHQWGKMCLYFESFSMLLHYIFCDHMYLMQLRYVKSNSENFELTFSVFFMFCFLIVICIVFDKICFHSLYIYMCICNYRVCIYIYFRVHYVKCHAGRITNWNQDCPEKYKQPQIYWW